MQRLSSNFRRAVWIVEKISGERVSQMGKMHADLMGAPGLKADAQQRKTTRRDLQGF